MMGEISFKKPRNKGLIEYIVTLRGGYWRVNDFPKQWFGNLNQLKL